MSKFEPSRNYVSGDVRIEGDLVVTGTVTSSGASGGTGPDFQDLILLPDTPDQDIYNDAKIYVKLDDASTDDIEVKVNANPSSGDVAFVWESNGSSPTSGGTSINTSDGITVINGNFGSYDKMTMVVFAPADSSYPYYEFTFTKAAASDSFVTKVSKWNSID